MMNPGQFYGGFAVAQPVQPAAAGWTGVNAGLRPVLVPGGPAWMPGGGAVVCQHKKKKKKPQVEDSSDEEETIFVRKAQKPQVEYIRKEIVVPPPAPQPPQVIIMAPPPPQPSPHPSIKNQENPNSKVVVYAPQIIQANKNLTNFQEDDSVTDLVSYRPQYRSFNQSNDGRVYDSRADNRIYYNNQDQRYVYYQSDQQAYRNNQDNRAFSYRADNRSNREDNRIAASYNAQPGNGYGYYRAGEMDERARADQDAVLAYNAQAYNDYARNADYYYGDNYY